MARAYTSSSGNRAARVGLFESRKMAGVGTLVWAVRRKCHSNLPASGRPKSARKWKSESTLSASAARPQKSPHSRERPNWFTLSTSVDGKMGSTRRSGFQRLKPTPLLTLPALPFPNSIPPQYAMPWQRSGCPSLKLRGGCVSASTQWSIGQLRWATANTAWPWLSSIKHFQSREHVPSILRPWPTRSYRPFCKRCDLVRA